MRLWLRIAREKKGMSQKDVADMAQITQPTYWEYENGKTRPRPAVARRIAGILEIEWTKFYDEEDEP